MDHFMYEFREKYFPKRDTCEHWPCNYVGCDGCKHYKIKAVELLKTESDYHAKQDKGKPTLSLVPIKAIFAVERIRRYGNNKYPEGGKDNWRTVEPDRHYEASLRHIAKHWDDPFKIDPESGEPHFFHHLCDDFFFVAANWDKFMEAIEDFKKKRDDLT